MKRLCLALAMLYAGAAGAAFKCVDENGTTHIGDTPPAGCATVKMYEINRSGAVLRTIDPTPTAEELKAKTEAMAKQKEIDKALGEQKRKDMALLNTYATEKEFEVAKERNIDPVRSRIASATERIRAVEKRQKEIEEEMEFYKAGKGKGKSNEPPKGLTADLDRVRAEKSALISTIARDEKEIEAIKDKFDIDRKRWLDLKSGAANKPKEDEAKGPATITLSAGAAGKAKCGDKIYECPAGKSYVCKEGRKETKVDCVVERK